MAVTLMVFAVAMAEGRTEPSAQTGRKGDATRSMCVGHSVHIICVRCPVRCCERQVIMIGHAHTGSGWFADFGWEYQNLVSLWLLPVIGSSALAVVALIALPLVALRVCACA